MTTEKSDPAFERQHIRQMPRYIYALIVIAALVIAITISYSTYISNRAVNVYSLQIDTIHEIRSSSTLAHLWAEELLLSDPDVTADEVMKYYDRSYDYVTAMLYGGSVHARTFSAVKDIDLQNILKELQLKILLCKDITEDRFSLKSGAVVGTDLDRRMDESFKDLLSTAISAETRLHAVIGKDMKVFYYVQSILIFLSVLLSAIVGVVVYRFDRRRSHDFLTIQHQNRRLNDLNDQLTAKEQQLRASNQQLMASEQQLKAANQQLMASEQQLMATNQQLRASDHALRESESRYRSLFRDMGEGVALHRVIYNEDGHPVNYEIININPQYEIILNISRDQAVGKTATEVYGSPEPPYLSIFAHVAETGQPYHFETYFPPMGKYFDISVSSFEKGYFATIFSDITERKRTEETLRLNESRLEILWDISQYKSTDIKDLLDYALEKAIQLTGSRLGYIYHYNEQRKEFILNSWSKNVMNECTIREKDTRYSLDKTGIWGEAVRQRRPVIVNDFQYPNALKKGYPEGHAHLNRFMTIPVFNDEKIVAVIGVANKAEEYDQTDIKQLTLFMNSVWKIFEYNLTVETRQQLETQMQKLESLGVLAGGIAHDFNNLLTAILANINFVSIRLNNDDRARLMLLEAEKACNRAQYLTKQLLTFSRGGAPVKNIVNPVEVITDSAQFAILGSRARCEFVFPDDLWSVDIDEGQIGQAINNLVINAVQSMPEGGTITITASNFDVTEESVPPLRKGPYVKISIADSGTGIAEEYLQRVFDPYFTTKQNGSGLGLAVTYSIINKHDGHITVSSERGTGTVFEIYLPATQQKVFREKPVDRPIPAGKGHILFMDDEEMVTAVAVEILQEYGYEVTPAGDGKDAIDLYKKMMDSGNPFDLVIMDLTVPGGMGGKETIEKLLEIDPDVKAIVSSGFSNDHVLSDFRQYGFKGIIAKPYKVNELCETVHRVINNLQ